MKTHRRVMTNRRKSDVHTIIKLGFCTFRH